MRTTILGLLLLVLSSASVHARLYRDVEFGNAGIVDLDVGADWSGGEKMFVRPDRRIVLAAVANSNDLPETTLKVARLLPDGSPDPAFGTNGVSTIVLRSTTRAYGAVDQLVPLPDGRVYAWVMTWLETSGNFVYQAHLLRLLDDGRPDPGFNGGQPLILGATSQFLGDLLIYGDAALIVTPRRNEPGPDGFDALRLRSDGSPDPAFGSGGMLAVDGTEGSIFGAMPLPGGGFQVLHYVHLGPVLPSRSFWRRYLADGSLDTVFGSGGQQEIPRGPVGAVGKLLAVGDGTYIGLAACPSHRFGADGSLIAQFRHCLPQMPLLNQRVRLYGEKFLYSGDEWAFFMASPNDGTYLFAIDASGRVDSEFTAPQGDRWRSEIFGSGTLGEVAADGSEHVVLASATGYRFRILRYRDVRGGEPPWVQPVPALGWPALLLSALGLLWLVRRRMGHV